MITGVGSGRALTEAAVRRGDRVVGTVRTTAVVRRFQRETPGLTLVRLLALSEADAVAGTMTSILRDCPAPARRERRSAPLPIPFLRSVPNVAQLALTWVLRHPQVTSALVGASSVQQLESSLASLDFPDLTADELAAIEPHAVDGTEHR